MPQFVAGDVVRCTSSHQGMIKGALYTIESVETVGRGIAAYEVFTLGADFSDTYVRVVNIRFLARHLNEAEQVELASLIASRVSGINDK